MAPRGNRFRWIKAPSSAELTQLAHRIAHRVGRFLERQGLLEQDVENSYLASDAVDEGPMDLLLGHSITYRIAVGPQQGCKVFTLQTLPACDPEDGCTESVGKVAGCSLHAGVAARADGRKTPYRDGTTHVIFEPLDFIARLAALIPKPRVNLIRFHGVFAPNSKHRSKVTPASQAGQGQQDQNV